MNQRAPKGTADMLPETARVWEFMQRTAQQLFARYGYQPIYTPVFEHTEVFVRSIGEATDIVSKEMYTFEDRGGRSITLRPEATASIVRAALEHNLVPPGSATKLYFMGPMFRYERPQAGRMRQFWQIDAETLGAGEPSADAEMIALLVRYFESLGITGTTLLINSMGDDACRPQYRDKIAAYIREHSGELCEECERRAETNPLRAFDCKNPTCHDVMDLAPKLREELCPECAEHYASVKRYLDDLGIAYAEDPSLVRGLDYYTRTVFEVQAQGLGAQNAIGGGGRYDRLMEQFGGPATPGLGFALGFERTYLTMQAQGLSAPTLPIAEVYVARVDATVAADVFTLAARLREDGFAAELDHQGRSLKSQFKQADRLGARFVVVVGPDEMAAGEVTLREMATSEERKAPLSGVAEVLRGLLAES
jgi:histidyl-tRNA synthetase